MWRIAVIAALLSAVTVAAEDLGSVGKTYPVKERDALEEVQSRAALVNWKKELAKIKPEGYRPEHSVSLPRAQQKRSFLVDMTYTLPQDIPDGKGGIIYPRGYAFNPLDYIPFKKQLVVINAADKAQLTWFRQSPYSRRPDVMLLTTEGSALNFGEQLSRPVFFADGRIRDRFQLKAVPSVVRQEGRMMRVEEIDVRVSVKR